MLEVWVRRFGGSIAVLCFGSTAHAQAPSAEPRTAPATAASAAPAASATPSAPAAAGAIPSAAPSAMPAQPPAAAPVAAAPAPPTAAAVTVVTTDGAVFRGELIEKWPNHHVTVRLPTGEYRRISWQYVARLSSDMGAAAVNATVTTQVFFRSEDERAVLQRFVSGGTWYDVCRTPCAGKVASRGVYRIGGEGVRESEPFKLNGHGPYVAIETRRVGSDGTTALGGVMAIGGGIAAYAGMLVLAAAAADSPDEAPYGTAPEDNSDDDARVGLVMLLGGTAVGIVGLVTLLTNKTKIDLTELRPRRSTRSPSTPQRAGFSIPISKGFALTERGLVW